MIEVEKNFDLKAGDKERLIEGAKLVSKKTFTDIYYDAPKFEITGKDYWLRKRNDRFELKVPLSENKIAKTDQYHEIENDEEIAKALSISFSGDLAADLEKSSIKPFAKITTYREEYLKREFKLDFDEMDFGFSAFEVELMVERENQIQEAEDKIIEFGRKHGIAESNSHGKVIEYIQKNNLDHYNFLCQKGVIDAHFV